MTKVPGEFCTPSLQQLMAQMTKSHHVDVDLQTARRRRTAGLAAVSWPASLHTWKTTQHCSSSSFSLLASPSPSSWSFCLRHQATSLSSLTVILPFFLLTPFPHALNLPASRSFKPVQLNPLYTLFSISNQVKLSNDSGCIYTTLTVTLITTNSFSRYKSKWCGK